MAAPAAIPTRTFRDSLTMRVNGQRVVVTHIPAAHTDGDAIVWLPDANVLPNLTLDHSLDTLVEIGESFSAGKKIRLFAGYAGWSGGQLEDEMKRKAWLTYPASLELVFDTPADQLWQAVLHRKGGWRNKLRAQMPEDLSSN